MLAKFIDRPREDSLTASVFSHLLHLPIETFWRLLRDACPGDTLPNENPGEPKGVHSWPSWDATGTRNTVRVVPDLMIEFSKFDLIIEAKRWDFPMQDLEQWDAELRAYANEFGSLGKDVKMIALGGIHSHADKEIEVGFSVGPPSNEAMRAIKCTVHMCQWSRLLEVCCQWNSFLEKTSSKNSQSYADQRILKDVISLFIHHGFRPIQWFSDFNFDLNFLKPGVDADRQRLRIIAEQFAQSYEHHSRH